MEQINYLDPSTKTKGEELVSQQLLESYQSGVIDHDQKVISQRDKEMD
ncbi:hypothetical protein GH741_09165 [Aquibacillus halophilus]|uniref:Uncharacterized protein n=1 Tax=Aquibacillus halophilus TaxID=930132 RepID=A0A6A8DBF3_9BACI|nr:hypothetical protein [Aquibacillus halophilus]MRH42854.1 hypothetical protein [Aquibacillus halophilus]